MADYPDFSSYLIPRYGAPTMLQDIVPVNDSTLTQVALISGTGRLYAAHLWLQDEIGAQDSYFEIILDGVTVFDLAFETIFARGIYEMSGLSVYLVKYDTVNGWFGVVTGMFVLFESSVECKFYHTQGGWVNTYIEIYSALLT